MATDASDAEIEDATNIVVVDNGRGKKQRKARRRKALAAKFTTPKQRAARRRELKRRIKKHRAKIWYREKLIKRAGYEMKLLREMDE